MAVMTTEPTIAEAEAALADAEAAERETLQALAAVMAADEAGDPWRRPTARELQDARHNVQLASRARSAAGRALEVARMAAQRAQTEAARQRRNRDLDEYQACLDQAAAAWRKVQAHGPVAGLGPGRASPEGAAEFRAWRAANIP